MQLTFGAGLRALPGDSPEHGRPLEAHDEGLLSHSSQESPHMNTAAYLQQPAPLFGHSQHAGGWPKLGFETAEQPDELSADDEQE